MGISIKASLLASAIVVLVAADAFAAEKLTIAMDGASPPYNFTDSTGTIVGFEVDLAKDFCARLKAECTIVNQAWEGIIPSLNAKRYDIIMSGMSITDERRKQVSFTIPYSSTPSWLVGSKEVFQGVASLDDARRVLNGKTIGVQRGTIQQQTAEADFGKSGAEIKPYDTDDNLKIDLSSGRIDAALHVSVNLAPLLESPEGKDLLRFGPIIPDENGVGLAVRQDDTTLLARLNDVIGAAIADGTASKLSQIWLKFDGTPGKAP